MNREDLQEMRVPELREMCVDYQMPSHGVKSELIDRLLGEEESNEEDSDSGSEDEADVPIGELPIGKDLSAADQTSLVQFCKQGGIKTKEGFMQWLAALKQVTSQDRTALAASTGVSAMGLATLLKAIPSPKRQKGAANSNGTSDDNDFSDLDDFSDVEVPHFLLRGAAKGEQAQDDTGTRDARDSRVDRALERDRHKDGELFFEGFHIKSSATSSTHLSIPGEFEVNPALFQWRPGRDIQTRWRETLAPVASLFPKGDGIKKLHFTRPEITGRIEVLYAAQKKLEKLCFQDIFVFKRSSHKILDNPLPPKVWKELKAVHAGSTARDIAVGFRRNNDLRGKRCHRCGISGHLKSSCTSSSSRARAYDSNRSDSFQSNRPRLPSHPQ